ncbi:MAG TPA: hypothetical protein VGN84_04410 [Solirubrobacterales bacterium]|jgi:hypothetical protein|nr:hypothetical protein [Solirubrobacterales bacterium]
MDQRHAAIGGYYLGRNHALIHRHRERISITADQGARWELAINLSLPTDYQARCGGDGDSCLFLFPLMFLKKAEGRTGLIATDEDGRNLPLLNRGSCDWVSGIAATEAANRLAGRERRWPPPEPGKDDGSEDLCYVLQCVASQWPYDASVILNELLERLPADTAKKWTREGLTGDMKMLVEHSLVWVPLRGRPGERRVITASRDWELLPKSLLNLKVGTPKPSRFSHLRQRQKRRFEDPAAVLDTGTARYGRLARRVSFSVLGERLAQPLAWMPIEFDFPTIYTRRCSSYHFEMICPNGLSPHGIKVAIDRRDPSEGRTQVEGGENIDNRVAEVYLPGGRILGDLLIRATVGIGRGAFPVLWFLMGAFTAAMLWTFVSANPVELIGAHDSSNEIAAGILLVVPALLGALVVGAEQGLTTTRLIGGARMLLLACGLASALAATVLLGREPLGFSPRSQWTALAVLATAAMVPLATSWLLSLRLVWPRLKRFDSTRKQNSTLIAIIALALAIVLALERLGDREVLRILLAVGLIGLTVPMMLVANNRFAVPMEEKREFLSLGAFLAALACLFLGCIELRAAFDHQAHIHRLAEEIALCCLFIAPVVGPLLACVTTYFHAKPGEIHVAPAVAASLFQGKRVRELHTLRPDDPDGQDNGVDESDRDQALSLDESYAKVDEPYASIPIDRPVVEESVGRSAAGWSTGLRSTVELPRYEEGEFSFLVSRPARKKPHPSQELLEKKIHEKLSVHMNALRLDGY